MKLEQNHVYFTARKGTEAYKRAEDLFKAAEKSRKSRKAILKYLGLPKTTSVWTDLSGAITGFSVKGKADVPEGWKTRKLGEHKELTMFPRAMNANKEILKRLAACRQLTSSDGAVAMFGVAKLYFSGMVGYTGVNIEQLPSGRHILHFVSEEHANLYILPEKNLAQPGWSCPKGLTKVKFSTVAKWLEEE